MLLMSSNKYKTIIIKLRMDRDIRIFNRPIMDKIRQKNHQKHRQRLKNIKSGLFNRTTLSQRNSFKLNNTKAMFIEQQKKTEIQKNNVLLLNKMSDIARRPDQNQNVQTHAIWNCKNILQKSRIHEENKSTYQHKVIDMFVRLSHQRPTISNKKLHEQRSKNLSILRFLGKYPNIAAQSQKYESSYSNYIQNQSSYAQKRYYSTHNKISQTEQVGFPVKTESNFNQHAKNGKYHKLPQRRHKSQAINRESNHNKAQQNKGNKTLENEQLLQNKKQMGASHPRPCQTSPHRQSERASHSSNILLYKGRIQLHGKPAIIYCYRSYDSYEIAVQFETPIYGECEHLLVLSEEQGNTLFTNSNYDYRIIASMLCFQQRTLFIKPQSKITNDPKHKHRFNLLDDTINEQPEVFTAFEKTKHYPSNKKVNRISY